jgi:hypothetical protein
MKSRGTVRLSRDRCSDDRLPADRFAGDRKPLPPFFGGLRLAVGIQQEPIADGTAPLLRLQQAHSDAVQRR